MAAELAPKDTSRDTCQSEYALWKSPLSTRYASKEMRGNFSEQKKFSTWRRLWLYLATAEKVIIIYFLSTVMKYKPSHLLFSLCDTLFDYYGYLCAYDNHAIYDSSQ